MSKQGPGFLSGVSADTRRYVRELKNKVYNYTEMEQMVREATCNDPSPPPPALMREIAKGTFTCVQSCHGQGSQPWGGEISVRAQPQGLLQEEVGEWRQRRAPPWFSCCVRLSRHVIVACAQG